jgi:hypothetical protein
MNRRIPEVEPVWRLASGIAVFIIAMAVASLLCVDDFEPRRGSTEIDR